jgi:hypothetical protein
MHSFSLQKKLIRGKTNLREVKKKKKKKLGPWLLKSIQKHIKIMI